VDYEANFKHIEVIETMEWKKELYLITDDQSRIQLDIVIKFLCEESSWAQDIPPETIEVSILNSLCFSIFDDTKQIGFARVITDYSVFGYLEDVFINTAYRGAGIGQWLIDCILSHPNVKRLKTLMLTTEDAQGLYAKFGFTKVANPGMVMERYNREDFHLFGWAETNTPQ
jgi:GNAT superfamily N-acetyltransferase